MKKIFVVGALATSLIVTSIPSSLVLAAPNTSKQVTPVKNNERSVDLAFTNEDKMFDISQKVNQYLKLNSDGTVTLTANAKTIGTTTALLNQYQTGLDAINIAVKANQVKVNQDLTVSPIVSNSTQTVSPIVSNSTQVGEIQPNWTWHSDFYGWYFYLSNSESKNFVYNCNKWAAAGAGVAVISGYIASFGVPAAAAAALAAGLISAGLWWVGNEVDYYMTSKGTLIYLSNWNPFDVVQVSGR